MSCFNELSLLASAPICVTPIGERSSSLAARSFREAIALRRTTLWTSFCREAGNDRPTPCSGISLGDPREGKSKGSMIGASELATSLVEAYVTDPRSSIRKCPK